jgi:DNA-binding NarL/FixJ family response regulator
VRGGIRAMLAATDDLHIIAEAEAAAEAVRTAERERPDVIVMGIRLLDGMGTACGGEDHYRRRLRPQA